MLSSKQPGKVRFVSPPRYFPQMSTPPPDSGGAGQSKLGHKKRTIKVTENEAIKFANACEWLKACLDNSAVKGYISSQIDIPVEVIDKVMLLPVLKLKAKMDKGDAAPKTAPQPSKATYFNSPSAVTPRVAELYGYVANHMGGKRLIYNQVDQTCPLDIRNMLTAYTDLSNLDQSTGVMLDSFLSRNVADDAELALVNNKRYIPKKNSKAFWSIIKNLMAA